MFGVVAGTASVRQATAEAIAHGEAEARGRLHRQLQEHCASFGRAGGEIARAELMPFWAVGLASERDRPWTGLKAMQSARLAEMEPVAATGPPRKAGAG